MPQKLLGSNISAIMSTNTSPFSPVNSKHKFFASNFSSEILPHSSCNFPRSIPFNPTWDTCWKAVSPIVHIEQAPPKRSSKLACESSSFFGTPSSAVDRKISVRVVLNILKTQSEGQFISVGKITRNFVIGCCHALITCTHKMQMVWTFFRNSLSSFVQKMGSYFIPKKKVIPFSASLAHDSEKNAIFSFTMIRKHAKNAQLLPFTFSLFLLCKVEKYPEKFAIGIKNWSYVRLPRLFRKTNTVNHESSKNERFKCWIIWVKLGQIEGPKHLMNLLGWQNSKA